MKPDYIKLLAMTISVGIVSCADRVSSSPNIPLDFWLPKKRSTVDDQYRSQFENALHGRTAIPGIDPIIRGEEGSIQKLFAEVSDPELDGEKSEKYTYKLLFSLAYIGDAAFASALAGIPGPKRSLICERLKHRLEVFGEKVPRTKLLVGASGVGVN